MAKKRIPLTSTERQIRSRKSREKKGGKQINVWLEKRTLRKLNILIAQEGFKGTKASVITQAIDMLHADYKAERLRLKYSRASTLDYSEFGSWS